MLKELNNFLKDIKFVFIILSSLFLLIKSEPESELINIVLNESNFTDNYNIKSCLKFNVTFGKDYDYSNLKINVEGKNEINRILSYYQQDSNFNDRKQLSQSSTDPTIMWLNKEQIKNNFYFSIECIKYPCDFQIDLIGSNSSKLEIDTQYTYFVSEENKKMVFTIDTNKYIELFNNSDDYIVTIWAKGGQDIRSTLKGLDSIEEELSQDLKRMTTKKELAEIFNISLDDLEELIFARSQRDSDNFAFSDVREDDDIQMLSHIADDSIHFTDTVENQVFFEQLKTIIDSSDLNSKEKNVLYLRFGFDCDDNRTLMEVGKILGHSKQSIQQI